MLINGPDSSLEIVLTETVPTALQSAGDARLVISVRVANNQALFTGQLPVWIDALALGNFVSQLEKLNETRNGSAILDSLSPGELRLEIRNTDRSGHMAALGHIGRRFSPGGQDSVINFDVPFCPTELPRIISEFAIIASE